MGCLFALTAGFFPRIALVLLWIFTDDVDRAFDSFCLPLLRLNFLPLTWAPVVGIEGFDYFLVIFAFILDLLSYGGGARARAGRGD